MFFQFGMTFKKNFIFKICFYFNRRANGEITHIRIQRTNDGFDLGERQECFSTLYDMIEHYRQNIGELREKNNDVIELTAPILAQMPTLEK
jgi:hypothetical protein